MTIHVKSYDSGWIEIYVNGTLKYENHSIQIMDILKLLEIEYSIEYVED